VNLATAILKRGLARGREHPAIVHDGDTWSFDALKEASRRLAGALTEAGVHPGDRVAIAMQNRPEYYVALLACARIGAILATVHLDFGVEEVGYVLDNCEPACVLADRTGAELLARDPKLRSIAGPVLEIEQHGSTSFPGSVPLQEAVAGANTPPTLDVASSEPVLILYSSGTTARPKAVMSSHGAEAWSAEAHAKVWRITSEDRVVIPLTLAWAYGLATVGLSCLYAGATVVLMPRYTPHLLAETTERERVTLFFGVTTMFVMLANYARGQTQLPDMTSIRFALSGGERRDEEAFEWFRQTTGAAVSDAYAMSEVRPVLTYDPQVDPHPRPGVSGRLVPGVELKLCDERGDEVAPQGQGEAWVRSQGMFSGYFRQPELTSATLTADGWFRTGDILRDEGDSYYSFVARRDDIIRRAGANVSPVEVQNILVQHPLVADAAVTGVRHDVYGEEVGALVTLSAGEVPASIGDELRDFVAAHLASYKTPTIVRVIDAIPRNANGKFDRTTISRLLAEAREPQP
jgi:long-chain acyl-CoA synthetase